MTGPAAERRVLARLANPDPDALAAMKATRWTAHNIPLSNRDSTLGQGRPLIGDDVRTRTIKRQFYLLNNGERTLSGLRVLDLGCLEGGLAFEMAREGAQVLGVEGRTSNYRKCTRIADYFELPNLEFLHADVKDLTPSAQGRFERVICCGLLYHLDMPFTFLRRLYDLMSGFGVLFLDTHIAPETDTELGACVFGEQLSERTTLADAGHDYPGRWFRECAGGAGLPGDEDAPWASVSNAESFWPTLESLMYSLYRAGFSCVYELYGSYPLEQEFALKRRYSRRYWVAIKDSGPSAGRHAPSEFCIER